MSILSWNCRGLGNLPTVRDLCRLVKEKRPKLVFLMETKLRSYRVEGIKIRMGFRNVFVVDCVGKSGGLALMWSDDIQVDIQNYSRRHINAVVKTEMNGQLWKFTGFYGHPDVGRRHEAWSLLRQLESFSPKAWLCVGDYNEIMEADEKFGAVTKSRRQMRDFCNTLEACNLQDLGYVGPKFTWCNMRDEDNFIKERLDRVCANSRWLGLYPISEVKILATRNSDHSPIAFTFHVEGGGSRCYKKQFRYEAGWGKNERAKRVVHQIWRVKIPRKEGWHAIKQKLGNSKQGLLRWQQVNKCPTEEVIKQKTQLISSLQEVEGMPDLVNIRTLQGEVNELMEEEDLKWRQRANEHWLSMGDKNTKYFHSCVKNRRKNNTINSIVDVEGQQHSTPEAVEDAFINYFKNIFMSSNPSGLSLGLDALPCRITPEMNAQLLWDFRKEEVWAALQQMAPLKSPGPDGFPACFYQDQWETVGPEVCDAILNFVKGGSFDEDVNYTHIVLIPKSRQPSKVSDFRPISLCNVLYKILSKVLANRLKEVLPFIISSTQSAFIPRRLISDNILAAYETLHTMHARMWGKEGFMAVKIDMSKAYDRVEWVFLKEVMGKLGFAPRWIDLIMKCITTVRYSIVVNGQPVGDFRPSRGIRQGDPLSPYLFILCAEVLSSKLQQAERQGILRGVPTSVGGPRLTHLFFADDSLLFCKVNQDEWKCLYDLLAGYEEASGQKA
jgi:exonuclease III